MLEGELSLSALQELCSACVEMTAVIGNNYIYISELQLRPKNTSLFKLVLMDVDCKICMPALIHSLATWGP